MTMSDDIFNFLKPNELHVYCEKPASATIKPSYRRVFDEVEVTVLYVDFLFTNEMCGIEEWTAEFQFKAYRLDDNGRDEVISWDVSKTIIPEEKLVTVTDFWGEEDQNVFWGEGEYVWEVWHKNTLLRETKFYIENIGEVTSDNNPYLDFLLLKLFEGPSELPEYGGRKYLSQFQFNTTKCIWVEFEFSNLSPFKKWEGEFFFNFYNDMKELVGSVVKLEEVVSTDVNNTYKVFAALGHDTNVTWKKDHYTVEVVFMDKLAAVASFEVSDTDNRGELKVEAYAKKGISVQLAEPISDEKFVFNELDNLIGLKDIKKNLHEYYTFAQYVLLRKHKGIEDKDEVNLNFVFTGNPGTGKTTVARMLGKLYKSLGLLSKDTVFEVDRSHLIGRYIGETAPQTKEVIEKARGGILFIDEAYALYRNDDKDFGHEAIEVIMKELSDGPGDISIIVAGYPKEMKGFLESNTGLKSRFNNHYDFDDYIPEELMEIASKMAEKKSLIISDYAKGSLFKIIVDEYRKRERTFGNARFISSLIEEAQVNLGLRVMQSINPGDLSLEFISTIEKDDIDKIKEKTECKPPDFPIDEELLKESLQQLNSLVGLSSVKSEIIEIVKLVRFFKENKKNVLNSLSLHNVFAGSPGTGKTTVARILANIYRALGLLEKGHLVECTRDSLVAGFVGQTAIKTREKIDESMGGVLFIDEAYSLTRGMDGVDYGPEAIEIILQAIENHRGKFALITAGYTEEMVEFIRSNPGLKSRFDNFINFGDYNPNEMMFIAERILADKEIVIEKAAKNHLEEYFAFHYRNKDKFFGNARFVRKVIEQAVRNIYVRLSDIESEKRTEEMMKILTLKDVEEFLPSKEKFLSEKRKMGF